MRRIAPYAGLAFLFISLLVLPLKVESQPLRISEASVDAGNLRMGFVADTNWYYVLERAYEPSGNFDPVAMLLPVMTNGVFIGEIGHANAFYRLHAVPLTAPLDMDFDGMDDVYELRRQPELNPLNPGDANQDPDKDGFTNVQEYRGKLFDEAARRIGVGDSHFLVLRPDGTLWACGANRSGQLGDGSTNSTTDLVLIEPASRWAAVAAGGGRSYGIQTDGSLWAWGEGRYAPLGDGVNTNHWRPTRIGNEHDWKSLAAAANHTVAIKQDGSLWAWGVNSTGQLGDSSQTDRATPVRVGNENDWVSLGVGQNLTLALKTDGRLFACGNNEWGQLGIGGTNQIADVLTPVTSNFLWQAIGPGDFHGLAIRNDHTLWAWGHLYEDASSGFILATNHCAPVQIGTNANWLRVAGGYQHSVAMDADGSLWAFGYNAFGEVGDGTQLPRPFPTRIAVQDRWICVATKSLNHVGIRTDGTLWNWSGKNGQYLGNSELFTPVMPARRFRAIAAGDYHSVAIDENGSVWTWGANDAGQLGDGTTNPGLPRPIATNITCTLIAAGGKYSLAVDEANRLWSWGWLAPGFGGGIIPYLLNGGTPELRAWKAVASGSSHWLALDTEGHLLVFGENTYRQIPDTSLMTNAFSAIGAGAWSSLAIDKGGSLYIWGNFSTSTFPTYDGLVSTPGFTFQSAIGGAMHALFIRNDGTLWSMGDNKWGQLGIGTNSYAGLLKPVMTNYTWRAASAYYHNLAIRSDGTLWFWGYDGNMAITRAPVQISTAIGWKAVVAGYKHSLALKEDGTIWASGDNSYGQLGLSPFRQYDVGGNWKPPTPSFTPQNAVSPK